MGSLLRTALRGLLVGLVVGAIGGGLMLSPIGLDFEKEVGLSWLFRVRGSVPPPPDMAIVAIDGQTGASLGLPRLPRDWPRSTHARVITRLAEAGASAIVVDMDFSRAKAEEEDLALARAVEAADRVVLYEMLIGRRQRLEGVDGSTAGWTWVEERRPPTPVVAEAAKALAAFPLPKLGEAAYQFWAFKESGGGAPTTAAIALQFHAHEAFDHWRTVLRDAGASDLADLPSPRLIEDDPERVVEVMKAWRDAFRTRPDLGQRVEAMLDQRQHGSIEEHALLAALVDLYAGANSYFLNFYGPPGTVPTLPYAAFAGADRPTYDLEGKVVFIGYSDIFDPEQPDAFYTVFRSEDGVDLSGVEIMATGFGNLLSGATIRPLGEWAAGGLVFGFGLLVGVIGATLPAVFATVFILSVAGFYAAAAQVGFATTNLWLPLAAPLLVQVPLALILGLMAQYLIGKTRERRLGEAISRYVPENVRRDLVEGQVNPAAVDRVVYGTCFATDMAGFTTISESKTPKELADFMNAYFDALAQALKRHHVDVTEFHADTIMCAWTATEPEVAVRHQAVHAAIDLTKEIQAFALAQKLPRLNPRIGLQEGWFYLGHTGGGGRMAFSILGDPANTAARLEGLNKMLQTSALATQSVVDGIDDVLVRPLGSFVFLGKGDALPVVELVASRSEATADQLRLCDRFTEAMDKVREGSLGEASRLFDALLEDFQDDGPSSFYRQRLEGFIKGEHADEEPLVVRLQSK